MSKRRYQFRVKSGVITLTVIQEGDSGEATIETGKGMITRKVRNVAEYVRGWTDVIEVLGGKIRVDDLESGESLEQEVLS